jgi:hypothetical protein
MAILPNALRPSKFDYREMDYVAKQEKLPPTLIRDESGTGGW